MNRIQEKMQKTFLGLVVDESGFLCYDNPAQECGMQQFPV